MPKRARKSPEEVSVSRAKAGRAGWEALARRFNGDESLMKAYMSAMAASRAQNEEIPTP